MDVRLSSEQKALRDAAAQLVERLGPGSVAALGDAERHDKLEAAVAGAGWRELREADDDGNPYASAVEVALVAEELSRGLADVPFLGPVLASELRRRAGVEAPATLETVALTADLSALAAGVDVPVGTLALDAAGAATALLLIGDGGVPVLGRTMVTPLADQHVDLTRTTGAVAATAAGVGGAQLSADDMTRWAAFGTAIASAELLGIMRGALDTTVAYAKTRKQYGTAIGSFQAVQHLLADVHVLIEGARSLVQHAAWAADALEPAEALTAASLAKAYTARAARTACETAIQVHGGIGNTWECLAHVYLRRAFLSIDVLGGARTHLRNVLSGFGVV
ncbi:MAG TPA: acyl-CoA dehydrogenase family protein [Mycobacteriales bacterium]|nr:acyl-CoA dehydrogenase family protein [Mycobacteriales bacterium]